MRFVAAISVLVLAAIFLGTGFAQKLFFSGPEFAALSTTVEPATPYIVINGDVLKSHPGLQTVSVGGADVGFIGYGRTADVLAWLKGSDYATVTFNAKTQELGSQLVVSPANVAASDATIQGTPADKAVIAPVVNTIVDPAGSDLWLGERVGAMNVSLPMNADESMSVIIASDGVADAPAKVRLSWPIPNQSPFSTGFEIGRAHV